MRILKLALVLLFFAPAALPTLSSKLVALVRGAKSPQPVATATVNAGSVEAAALPFSTNPEEYTGSSSCAECHANQAAHYQLTAHRKTNIPGGKAEVMGCEACHGGAKAHVEYYQTVQKLNNDGKEAEAGALLADEAKSKAARLVALDKISPAAASASCLKCHEGSQGRSEERFNYRRSEHGRHGVSCIDCHSSHSPKRTEFLLRDDEPEGCYKCHQDQKASFAKPFHHKVPEGALKCSDCHNQHGGFQAKQLRSWAGGDNSCLKCHTDKQGPFAFEHAPIKVEGCQACHSPHGSTNPKLLKRSEVRFLCLECHSNAPGLNLPEDGTGLGPPTPSFHDITQPRIQNCANCHFTIHGSNLDPFFRR
jgi:DmsE family decaheme c-type cytochrome